jgi:secondary thiamine-phosphate synthase enzyme
VATKGRHQTVDITSDVGEVVAASGIGSGIALIYTSHTTTGLYINEGESGLVKDVDDTLCRLVPPGAGYRHDSVDDNADSHIQSVVLSASLTVPVDGARLHLGTWQRIMLAERDGPRHRTLTVKVLGDRE